MRFCLAISLLFVTSWLIPPVDATACCFSCYSKCYSKCYTPCRPVRPHAGGSAADDIGDAPEPPGLDGVKFRDKGRKIFRAARFRR